VESVLDRLVKSCKSSWLPLPRTASPWRGFTCPLSVNNIIVPPRLCGTFRAKLIPSPRTCRLGCRAACASFASGRSRCRRASVSARQLHTTPLRCLISLIGGNRVVSMHAEGCEHEGAAGRLHVTAGTRPMGQESDSIRFHVSAVDARARVTLPRRHRTVTKLTLNQRPGAARRSQSVSFCYHNTLQPLHTPHLIPAFQLSSSTYPQQLCSYTYIHLEHNHLVASIHKHHCLHRVRLSPVSKRSPRIGGDNVESGYRRLVSRLPPSL
jgi:hypothetical protein